MSDYDREKLCILSIVIRYYTQYHFNDDRPTLLALALGEVMIVNTILGNTVIKNLQLMLEFDPPLIRSSILEETYDVLYEPTQRSTLAVNATELNPTEAPSTQVSVLKDISGYEENTIAHPVLDTLWG